MRLKYINTLVMPELLQRITSLQVRFTDHMTKLIKLPLTEIFRPFWEMRSGLNGCKPNLRKP